MSWIRSRCTSLFLVFCCLLQIQPSTGCFDGVKSGSIRVVWGYEGSVFGPVSGGTVILLIATEGGLEALLGAGAAGGAGGAAGGVTVVLTRQGGPDLTCAESTEILQDDTQRGYVTPVGGASEVDQEFQIQLHCSADGEYLDLERSFIYKPEPKLYDQSFKTTIAGGIELTFRGENLMSVGFPIMMIFIEYKDEDNTEIQKGCYRHDNSAQWCKQICLLRNDTEFYCKSPDLNSLLPPEHGGNYLKGYEGNDGASWVVDHRAGPGLQYSETEEDLSQYMSALISANMTGSMTAGTGRKRRAATLTAGMAAGSGRERRAVTLTEALTVRVGRERRASTYIAVGPEVRKVTAILGVVLDGKRRGVTDGFELKVADDPIFEQFGVKKFNPEFPKNEDTLRITGKYVRSGAEARDYAVRIGNNLCPLVGSVHDNAIICKPPWSLTNHTGPKDGGGYQIVVEVGQNRISVGFLKYVRWYESSAFIGIVVTVVVVPLILIAVYFMITRCLRPCCDPKNYPWVPGSTHSNVYDIDVMTKIGPELSARVQQSGLLLPEHNSVRIVERIGHGNFGVVYAGFLQDNNNEYPEYVAIKTLKDSLDEDQVREMFREALVMKEFNHPNIARIVGIVIMRNQPHIVMPFMKNKDLKSHVKTTNHRFTVQDLLEYGIQIATGMAHVESKGIIHRDLAARNCMVSDEETIKVSDFGLARETSYRTREYTKQSKGGGLPVRWMAVESLKTLTFTTKTDVWSFGVILWELLTRGGHPYADTRDYDIKNFLQRGHRLEKPAMCPTEIYRIMVSCWEHEPQDRPNFAQLEARLREAVGRQPVHYTDPSVTQPYGDVEPPSTPSGTAGNPEDDPYTYLVPPGGGTARDGLGGGSGGSAGYRASMPVHNAPITPGGNNNIV